MTIALLAVCTVAIMANVFFYRTIIKLNRRHYHEMDRLHAEAYQERKELYSRIMSRDESQYQAHKRPPAPKQSKNFIKKSIEDTAKQGLSE